MTADHAVMSMFTIYFRPDDFPNVEYLVRRWDIHEGASRPGPILGSAMTLDAARMLIPAQADACVLRQDDDPPTIVETWL